MKLKKGKVLVLNTEVFPPGSSAMEELSHPDLPVQKTETLEAHGFTQCQLWSVLAQRVAASYYDYDGFVVICSAEQMVFNATALSFMMQNLGKPIVFTGWCVPVSDVNSDFNRNATLSLLIAANGDISEVVILFAEKLFRANRTTKISSISLQPFASPNFPALASMEGKKFRLESSRRPAPRGKLVIHKDLSATVLVIKVTPQLSPELLTDLLSVTEARAVVLCGFGSGNFPVMNGAYIKAVQPAAERGITVAAVSQVRHGGVDMTSYETGRQMLATGIVGVEDMTLEATVIKLKFLIGLRFSTEAIRRLLVEDLRGEITEHGVMSKL